jgi:hypothetical protein
MPDKPSFDPRQAALNHAGRAVAQTSKHGITDLSELASAIACGLVYVGDQLRELNTESSLADNRMANISSLLEKLDVTVNDRLVELTEAV